MMVAEVCRSLTFLLATCRSRISAQAAELMQELSMEAGKGSIVSRGALFRCMLFCWFVLQV